MQTMDKTGLFALAASVEEGLGGRFKEIDQVAWINSRRVLEAFRARRVSDACFAGTTGYGYDDLGRETLDAVYADVFGGESALVRLGFASGTHALTCMLFGALAPGDLLLSATGEPYDTLRTAVGTAGAEHGTLAFYGVGYRQTALLPDGAPDYGAIRMAAADPHIKAVLVQRSRGYAQRRALTVAEIGKIAETVKAVNPGAAVLCDNCYGEFCETREPTHAGADAVAGSLIKNPGGGLAPTGGYIAGRADLVEKAANRLTSPGIAGECGSTLGQNRLLFQGFALAPHTVAQALKTAAFCAGMLEALGFDTSPGPLEPRSDLIQAVFLKTPENLVKFCRGIQHGSPVDSFASPEPWKMPGYADQVVMAAGTFIQGASIELSCDGPIREPYAAYLQGGLTYELGKYGILKALEEMLGDGA